MNFGEVEVSPASLRKLLSAPEFGRRNILLDSVRDSSFLSSSTIQSVNAAGQHDGGLGCIDNGIFFYTTKFVPGTLNPSTAQGTPRQYPVKFLWIGSPLGTTDVTDTFSIYVADVNTQGFYPGAVPSAWLVNPRVALSVSQAKTDVIGWFDSNYPGGASGGVGSTNTGSNSTYGTLGGGTTAVGDISGIHSIDGQFWPIYDYVDDSVLLYFSIKTPNMNTLSIYCYKLTDTEFASPASSSEFLGGVYGFNATNSVHGSTTHHLLSSHRFSIVSPDPMVTLGRSSGAQSAVVLYSWGTFNGSTPDHGMRLMAAILNDIHGTASSPGGAINWDSRGATSEVPQMDEWGIYNVDKLGSIQVASNSTNHQQAVYSCIYNATSERDARKGSDGVVISAMQLRVCYYHPGTGAISFGSVPIKPQGEIDEIGHCRPQFTYLPDGLPKILFANFGFDQHLTLAYQYYHPDSLQPEKQKMITFPAFLKNPFAFPTFGKKKAHIQLQSNSLNISADPSGMSVFQVLESWGDDASIGYHPTTSFVKSTFVLLDQSPPYQYDGTDPTNGNEVSNVLIEEVRAPFIQLTGLGATAKNWEFGIVEMSD